MDWHGGARSKQYSRHSSDIDEKGGNTDDVREAPQGLGAEGYDGEAMQSQSRFGAFGCGDSDAHSRGHSGASGSSRSYPTREFHRREQRSDSPGFHGHTDTVHQRYEETRGGRHTGYNREAPQSRGGGGHDSGAPQRRGQYDSGAPQSRGASGPRSQGDQGSLELNWRASGLSDRTRDVHRGERSGQDDTRHQWSREGHTGRSYGGQGYKSRPERSEKWPARFPVTRHGNEDGQDDFKRLEENMAKMAVSRESGKQLSLAGRRGDLTDVPAEEPMQEPDEYGTTGERFQFSTNLFRLEVNEKKFHQYSIELTPSFQSTRLKKKIVKSIEGQLGISRNYVTDGSRLYTIDLLREDVDSPINIEAPYKTKVYKVTISYDTTVEPTSRLGIQILNVIFGCLLQNKGWRWSDGSYYNFSQMIPIDGTSLRACPGFYISILEYTSGIRLLVDVSHKFISSENVWMASSHDRRKLKVGVTGRIVFTYYNGRMYKVDDVDMAKTVKTRFNHRGRDVTLMEYYRVKYGVNITDTNQPLLVVKRSSNLPSSGPPDVIYLVPELCMVTGITGRDRSDCYFMEKLNVVTRPKPNIRAHKLLDFVKDLQGDVAISGALNYFDIELATSMESFMGRKLPYSHLSRWSPELKKPLPYVRGELVTWTVLHPVSQAKLETFLHTLCGSIRQFGMRCEDPRMIAYRNIYDLERLLKDIPDNSNFVMVIVEGNYHQDYRCIKTNLCVNKSVPSQVITSRFVQHLANHVKCANVALQIICKMGGAGWSLQEMNARETIIIGVDTHLDKDGVCHMGIVATMDALCTSYHSTWCRLDQGQSICRSFGQMLIECLEAYRGINGHHCEKVVIYRDGVDEGQLEELVEYEVNDTERVVEDFGINIVYVVVNERHRSLFFWKIASGDAATYESVNRRILVDEVMTRPGRKDFFIIRRNGWNAKSHMASTHYNIIRNSTNMTIDDIQLLTNKLGRIYFNIRDHISVPSTCRYAHTVASMIGMDLNGQFPSERLKDKLFYL